MKFFEDDSDQSIERDDLNLNECLSNVLLFFIYFFLLITCIIRSYQRWIKQRKYFLSLHYCILLLLSLCFFSRMFYLFDGFSWIFRTNDKLYHFIPLPMYLATNDISDFSISQTALCFSLLWMRISIQLVANNYLQKAILKLIYLMLFINPAMVFMEIYFNYYHMNVSNSLTSGVQTIIVLFLVTVSGMAFIRGVSTQYKGRFLKNVSQSSLTLGKNKCLDHHFLFHIERNF